MAQGRAAGLTDAQRLWRRFYRDANGCWIWTGATTNGYGRVGMSDPRRRTVLAHRAMYELIVGPIPDGMTLDHLCEVTLCINPMHLEPCAPKDNTLRSTRNPLMVAYRNRTCTKGHPISGDNRMKHGTKYECRTCVNARRRKTQSNQTRQEQNR